MGIFKSKQITAETTEPEKNDEPVAVGFSGDVEIGDKIFKIENGLIMDVIEKETEVEPITEQATNELTEAQKEIENLKLENEKLINTINEAKLTISSPKLPVAEFSDDKVKNQKNIVNSRSYIYEVQKRKYENNLKNE
jgi:septal ring factor EnvC (AmiA/AmiB activator)